MPSGCDEYARGVRRRGPVIAGRQGWQAGNLHLGDPAISLLFINAPAASSAGHSELPISPRQPKHSKREKKKNRMEKFQLQAVAAGSGVTSLQPYI